MLYYHIKNISCLSVVISFNFNFYKNFNYIMLNKYYYATINDFENHSDIKTEWGKAVTIMAVVDGDDELDNEVLRVVVFGWMF